MLQVDVYKLQFYCLMNQPSGMSFLEEDALYEDVNDDVFATGNESITNGFGATGNDVTSSPKWFESVTDYTEYDQVIRTSFFEYLRKIVYSLSIVYFNMSLCTVVEIGPFQ